MTTEKVKDLIGRIGAIWYGKYYDMQDVYSQNKTEENDTLLHIYQKVYKMLDELSATLDMELFKTVGLELRQKEKDSNLPMEEIFTDLTVVNALLKCIREGD